jgi:hypothetical protein
MSDSVIRAAVTDLSNFIISNSVGGPPLTTDILVGILQTYMASRANLNIPLTNVSVDYEQNKAELEAILATTNTWKDAYTAATGQALIRMISAALTYDQFSLVRSAQETMLPTATIDSSIYTGTKHLGVRLARRIPAGIPVTLTRGGDTSISYTILLYSTFISNGVNLFNRDILTFPSGSASITATLYEGSVQTTAFISNGGAFQSLEIGASDYTISDIDVVVKVNNIVWSRTSYQQYFNVGLWEYGPNDQVFEDETTPDGNVNINFGNGINGSVPTIGTNIAISYVNTNGQEGNIDLTGATVDFSANNLIAGLITGIGVNGTDEKSASDYKTLGPGLFYAKYRATNRASHAAIARRYPGVIDAIFEGQQELHPSDLRYCMIQRATLLTNTVWSSDDWTAFINWFENLGIANGIIQSNNATAVPVNFTANVFIKSISIPATTVQNKIIANARAKFLPRAGILGYSRYISDFEDIIKKSDVSIDYFDITTPTSDTVINAYQYVTLGTITINIDYSTRGTLS